MKNKGYIMEYFQEREEEYLEKLIKKYYLAVKR